jgi:exodeoxyribonuclease VII small subunit
VSIHQDSTQSYASNQTSDDRHVPVGLPSPGWSYEETVRQVETIMTRIESGELELADVFDQFTTAVSYLRECELFLSQRQQQMDLLVETLTDDLE